MLREVTPAWRCCRARQLLTADSWAYISTLAAPGGGTCRLVRAGHGVLCKLSLWNLRPGAVQNTSTHPHKQQAAPSTTHSSPTLGGKIVADSLLHIRYLLICNYTAPPTIYTYLVFIIDVSQGRTEALHGPRPSYCIHITYCRNSSALQHCSNAPLWCRCP